MHVSFIKVMNDNRKYIKTLIGARSRNAGETFERFIDAGCNHYRSIGLANIEKTPEPMRPLKSLGGGKFLAVFSKAAQPDYKGTMTGGRSIVFESKHTDTGKITFDRLSDEQLTQLRLHAELGANVFVLCSFRFERFAAIPFAKWERMKEVYGRKYITVNDIGGDEVFLVRNYLDFINTLDDLRG